MELTPQKWDTMKKIFNAAFNSSFHFAIATVNKDGAPHVTPIGSVFLLDYPKAFYFEDYPSNLTRNLQHQKRVCVMAVNTGTWTMIKSFFLGKFLVPPGVRLMGTVSERRKATSEEKKLFRNRVKRYRMFKGYNLLWSKLTYVREIQFDSYEPVRIGSLTRHIWND